MINQFIAQAKSGNNKWWAYLLNIVSVVVVFVASNIVVQKILPTLKALLPNNQFGKDLGTLTLTGTVFGIGLLVFIVAFQKLHQRSWKSLVNISQDFSIKNYFLGFFSWGILLFGASLVSDYSKFETFLQQFNVQNFTVLLLVGFVSIGIQSFFEEILIRGAWLQGMGLKIRNVIALSATNGLVFGLLHMGYGIDSFVSSLLFGVVFAFVVTELQGIEFVSGAHNANNLVLMLFFIDLSEAVNEKFSWAINFQELILHVLILGIFTIFALKFVKKDAPSQI